MPEINNKQEWGKYRDKELATVSTILEQLGFHLEKDQPHIMGERYLMQAVTTTSGKKLILLGLRNKDKKRVVIKVSSDPKGIHELERERTLRWALQKIGFAYQAFPLPQEILFIKKEGFTISVQKFLEHERPFLDRNTQEQFSLILEAFKTQEGAHATTYKHKRIIKKTFGEKNAKDYIKMFNTFKAHICKTLPEEERLHLLLKESHSFLQKNNRTIEQYCGFLTHTDLVPHNFRVVKDKIYLLDQSSIRFGNKYEGWARFLNFMTLYNQPLEEALLFYVKNNRAKEEYLSLKLMRIYRLGEIIWFYTDLLEKTSGDLLVLTKLRVQFWTSVLEAVLENRQISKRIVDEYKHARDTLRSDEEKLRQVGLH